MTKKAKCKTRSQSRGKSNPRNRVKSSEKNTVNSSEKNVEEPKKAPDAVQVRENISKLVRGSAESIAKKVIADAVGGQLASAKYLFEATGLYPPTEETAGIPAEDSLAYTLLRRMGLPVEPVITDEDEQEEQRVVPAEGEE